MPVDLHPIAPAALANVGVDTTLLLRLVVGARWSPPLPAVVTNIEPPRDLERISRGGGTEQVASEAGMAACPTGGNSRRCMSARLGRASPGWRERLRSELCI